MNPEDALRARLRDALTRPLHGQPLASDEEMYTARVDALMSEISHEFQALRSKVEDLQACNDELRTWEVGFKSMTATNGCISMELDMAHDMMRVFVAAFVELLDKEGGPNYLELDYQLAGTPDRYVLTIHRPNGKTPGVVAAEQRDRAERAEAAVERVRALAVAAQGEAERSFSRMLGGAPVPASLPVSDVLAALDRPKVDR